MRHFQVEMDDAAVKELEEIMRVCGLRTKKELFNNAFTLWKWAVRKKKEGSEIVAVNKKGYYQELEMPALEAAASREAPS